MPEEMRSIGKANEKRVHSLKTRLESCAKVFDRDPECFLPDHILKEVFSTHQANNDIKVVRHKVILLNALYHTGVLDVYGMAEHIARSRKLDVYIKGKNLEAVALIRKGHGIKTKRGKERDFYSFATKYCHWHRPDIYPMYDSYVAVALHWLNRKVQFREPAFSLEELQDYTFFVETVKACREKFQLNWGFKRLDQALWIFGYDIG